jgi:hypothetical protein
VTQTTTAVYENGVLRPTTPLPLKEGETVQVTVTTAAPPPPAGPPDVRAILARRYTSGVPDTAARHDEHQP